MTRRNLLALLGILAVLALSAALRNSPPREAPAAPLPEAVAAPAPPASAADRVVPVDHPGPAGVAWGTSPGDAKRLLQKKLRLAWEGPETDERAWLQQYTGEFAGLAVEQVEASFAYDKARPRERPLMAFVVTLGARDVRPASRRWLDIVAKMEAAYGQPSRIAPIPADVGGTVSERAKTSEHFQGSLSALGQLLSATRFDQLDRQIAQGSWQPIAHWKFQNHVQVTATVLVSQPDKYGRRELRPAWVFMHEDLSNEFLGSGGRSRDF